MPQRLLLLVPLYIFTVGVFFQCNSPNKKDSEAKSIIKVDSTSKSKKITGQSLRGIVCLDEKISYDIFTDKALGIQAITLLDISKALIDSIKRQGFDGFYVNMICRTDIGTEICSEQFVSEDNRIHSNKGPFISAPGRRTISYHFPYRDMELTEGNHKFVVGYSLKPVRFRKDSSNSRFCMIDKIEKTILAYDFFEINIPFPHMHEISIAVDKFVLNTTGKDIHTYDFSLGGGGLPDLYWDIYVGDRLIYYSPQKKNVLEYLQPYTSATFFCSDKDILKINFADYDNGPFNTQDDVIEGWEGTISQLPFKKKDTLHFKKVEYAILQAHYVGRSVKEKPLNGANPQAFH